MRRALTCVLLLVCLLVGSITLGVGQLVIADRGPSGSATQQEANDTLHYWGHLLLGRGLSLTPGMRQHASVQYWKAAVHARTPQEQALLSSERPHTVLQGMTDVARMSWLGLQAIVPGGLVPPLLLSSGCIVVLTLAWPGMRRLPT